MPWCIVVVPCGGAQFEPWAVAIAVQLIEDLVVQFSALPRPLDELRNLNLRLLAVPVRPGLSRDLDQLVGVVQHCVPPKFQRDKITMNMFM